MADSHYVVQLDLRRVGDFDLGEATKKIQPLDKSLAKITDRFDTSRSLVKDLGSAVDRTVMSMGRMAVHGGMLVAGGAIAAATYGVMGLNAELQKSQVSLGTIFSAQGLVKDVPSGIQMAGDTIKQMRLDAQKLPGEFQDLFGIYVTGATSAVRSGLDQNQWEKLASKAMAAGAVSQLPMDVVAREFAMLIEGRSGAHNMFGMRLMGLAGDRAKEFNALSNQERIKVLSKELDKYAGAIDAFSSTYEAQSSTLVDNLKITGQQLSKPLFDRVTSTLSDINSWFNAHQLEISIWADHTGQKIGEMWDYGRKKLEEWGPVVLDFGRNLVDKVGPLIHELEPAASRFGAALKEALKDPGTIDKLIELGKLYLELKTVGAVGGGLLGGAADTARAALLVRDISGLLSTVRTAGALGGGVASAAGAGGAVGSLGVPALLGTIGVLGMGATVAAAGHYGGQDAAFSVASLTPLLGQLTPEFHLLYDATVGLRGALKDHRDTVDADTRAYLDKYAASDQASADFVPLTDGLDAFRGTLKQLEDAGDFTARAELIRDLRKQAQDDALYGTIQNLAAEQETLIESSNLAGAALLDLRMAALTASHSVGLGDFNQNIRDQIYGLDMAAMALANLDKRNAGKKKKPDMKTGHGGHTTINVQMTVTSNNDPSRVALQVRNELAKLRRNRGSSPHAPNYSRFGI